MLLVETRLGVFVLFFFSMFFLCVCVKSAEQEREVLQISVVSCLSGTGSRFGVSLN